MRRASRSAGRRLRETRWRTFSFGMPMANRWRLVSLVLQTMRRRARAIGVKEPTLSPHPPFTLRWAAPAGSWASRCSSPRGGPRASRRCGPGAPGATTPTPTGPSTTRRRPRGRTRRRTSSRRPPRGTRRPCRGSRSPGPSSSRRGRRASSRAAASCPTSTRASAVRSPQGSKRVIQRRFNVSVARARVSETAPTLRERSER